MSFVKPNHIILDPRAQEEKDRDLYASTQENLFHIQRQLQEHGTSLEAVLCAAAKAHMGVRIDPHAPVEKAAAA